MSEYQERLAARFSLIPWDDGRGGGWVALSYESKVRAVAFMRIQDAIDENGRDAMRKL